MTKPKKVPVYFDYEAKPLSLTCEDGPLGTIRYHRHIEAARLAYRDRDAFLADPSQADVPVAHLSSEQYLSGLGRAVRHSVPPPIAMVTCYPANPTAQVAGLDFYKEAVAFASPAGTIRSIW